LWTRYLECVRDVVDLVVPDADAAGCLGSPPRARVRACVGHVRFALGHNEVVLRDGSVLRAAAVLGASFRADLLAEVLGVDRLSALDALADDVEPGGLGLDAGVGRFVDVAGLREVYDAIAPSERARLHGRAAAVLIGWSEDGRRVDPAEVGRHLLASGADDRRAAEFLVSAGDLAMGDRDYAAAEKHYEQALEALQVEADADGARAAAAIALGAARLARGDLRRARTAYEAAAAAARRAGRGDLLARAALGLGSGAAGFEVGLADRVQLDLLEEALAALAEDDSSLRAQLLARLAVASSVVEADPRRRSLVNEAVELARSVEDRSALGVALAAECDAVAGPDQVELRCRLADEVVHIARAVRDGELELLGRRHRLVALAEAGDVAGIDAEVRDYSALADVLGQPLYGWYVPLWRGMRALMDGRTGECRRWLEDAATIGATGGSHNAVLLTATLRWCLLAEAADADGIAMLAEDLQRLGLGEEPGVWPGVALGLMAAETGRLAEARVRLDNVAPRLASAPRDSEWVPMLAQVAELVGHLGGHPVTSWTYEALRPFAELFVVEGIGAATRGFLHRHLGLLAAALGDTDAAAAHFAAALDVHRALGARLLVARTQRDRGVAMGDRQALAAASPTTSSSASRPGSASFASRLAPTLRPPGLALSGKARCGH